MHARNDRPSAQPVERVSNKHPEDESWRADAFAQSRHSRLLGELREPLEDRDPERAEALCAEVARAALLDFAPALILLPPAERRRVQALTAHALTLFDFARQTGLEGERLAQINRWEFELEASLSGDPPGQPIFVQMARTEEEHPWPREALDEVTAAARLRVMRPAPTTEAHLSHESRALGRALAGSLLGEISESTVDLAEGLVRLRGLLGLGEGLRRGRPTLPVGRDLQELTGEARREAIEAAIAEECPRVRALLGTSGAAVPGPYRRTARYLTLSGRALLSRVGRLGASIVDEPPTLGGLTRIGLLLRAWVSGS